MRKQLLTSTAIVAAGMLVAAGAAQAQQMTAQKGQFSLGGFHNTFIGFASQDKDADTVPAGRDLAALDLNQNTEVHFNGNVKLDNGISMRAHIELEGNSQSDIIDENYIIIRGSFGQFTIGSENGAAELMTAGYMGNSAGVGAHYYLDLTDLIQKEGWVGTSGTNGVSHFWTDGDNEKISYFTPRMSGLQIGGSYIPDYSAVGGDGDGGADIANVQNNGYQIGVNYVGKFSGASVAVAAGYHAASKPTDPTTTQTDFAEMGFGIRADFGPARVAMGYRSINEGDDGTTSQEGTIMHFGARYSMGATAVSAEYVIGDQKGLIANGNDNESTYIKVAAERTLGPGVKASLAYASADWEGEATGTADDNAGWAIIAGLKVGF